VKHLLYSALGLLFGLVLAFAALLGLAATETGTRWLVTAVTSSGIISLGQVRGTLLKRLELERIAFCGLKLQLELGRLSLSWQPKALLFGQLKIEELTLAQGLYRLQSAAPSVELPAVDLPLAVTVERAELIDLTVVQKESRLHFDKVLLAAELRGNQLTLRQLRLSTPPLALTASGKVTLTNDYPLEVRLTWRGLILGQAALGKASLTGTLRELTIAHSLTAPFHALTLGTVNALAPELPFQLHGSWENLTFPKEFRYASPAGSYRVRGDLKAYRLQLETSLHSQTLPPLKLDLNARRENNSLLLEPLVLHPPKGELIVTGQLRWKPEFAWQLSLKGRELDPGAFIPELPGRLEIQASSAGRWNRFRQATLAIERLRGKLRGQAVELLGKLSLQNGRWQSEGVELKSGLNRLQFQGYFGKGLDLRFMFDGERLSDLWPEISGRLNAQGRLTGSLVEPEIHLKAHGRAVAWGRNRIEQIALTLDFAPGTFASRQSLVLNQLKLQDLALEQVELTVRGSLAEHLGELNLKAPPGQLRAQVAGSYRAGIWQTACHSLVLQAANGRQLAFPEAGSLLAQARLDFTSQAMPLVARLNLRLELEKLAPWLGLLDRPQGQLTLELSASGPLRQPLTEARLSLQGAFGLRPAGIRLSEVELKVTKEQERWELSGSARSGAGNLKVSGWALPPSRLHLKFSGTDFEIARTLRLTAKATPELELDLNGQLGQLTGTLLIPAASLHLKQLPEGSVSVSEDEILVGAEQPPKPRFALAYKIQLILGDAVDFAGFKLKAKLSGTLETTGKVGGQTYLRGTVELKDASYQAYGQKLNLDKGRLIFTGPWDQPYLAFKASRTIEAAGVKVFLDVQGPARKPTASVTSQPPLPQTEALSYLFLGRSFTASGTSDQAALAKAALGLGVELALPWLKQLGLEAFAAKTGIGFQEEALGVGKYLTPELYLGYAFNLFNGVGKAVLRYRINRFLSLEAGAGAGQNIDLLYTMEAE
jgi:translocation and assembly module TamB